MYFFHHPRATRVRNFFYPGPAKKILSSSFFFFFIVALSSTITQPTNESFAR
jgi:hypothetical protein